MKKSDEYVYDEDSSLESNVSKFTMTLEISEDVVSSIYINTRSRQILNCSMNLGKEE
jgi:hypothetical protein